MCKLTQIKIPGIISISSGPEDLLSFTTTHPEGSPARKPGLEAKNNIIKPLRL